MLRKAPVLCASKVQERFCICSCYPMLVRLGAPCSATRWRRKKDAILHCSGKSHPWSLHPSRFLGDGDIMQHVYTHWHDSWTLCLTLLFWKWSLCHVAVQIRQGYAGGTSSKSPWLLTNTYLSLAWHASHCCLRALSPVISTLWPELMEQSTLRNAAWPCTK